MSSQTTDGPAEVPPEQVVKPIAVIRLARSDDMAAVRAGLTTARGRQAVLVVPGGTRLLRREVDFALLRRYVVTQGVAVALVSHDPQVRVLARRYNLPVAGSVGRAQKKVESLARKGGAKGSQGERSLRERWPRKAAHGGWEEWLLLLILILGAALVGAVGMLIVWPRATITIVPAGRLLEQDVEIVADPSIELVHEETAEIPARLIRVEIKGQSQVSTLARKDAPEARATGEVVFVNRTSGPVEVPRGTIVATSTGTTVKFATLEKVTLPAGLGSVVRVKIEALDPGPGGNAGSFLVNRVASAALALKVRVANEEPTEGGTVKQVGVVTAADKERLRSTLLQQLHQEAYARLQSELAPQEFLPIECVSVLVLDETYDHLLGEATDILGMTMRSRAQGIAFELSQAQKVARIMLERGVPAEHAFQSGTFHAEVLSVRMVVPETPSEEQSPCAQLTMKARGRTEATITPGRVIPLVQGKPKADAVAELQANLLLKERPLVSVEPDWWDRVPWLPFRIRVIVNSEHA